MHVHGYDLVLLLSLLPCVSASRVKVRVHVVGDTGRDEEFLIPGAGVPQPAARPTGTLPRFQALGEAHLGTTAVGEQPRTDDVEELDSKQGDAQGRSPLKTPRGIFPAPLRTHVGRIKRRASRIAMGLGDFFKIDTSASEARDEARVMGPTSDARVLPGASSTEKAVEMINALGVTRLNNVVASETIQSARAEVNQKLKVAQEVGGESVLGGVLCRTNRYDVLLDPADETIRSVMQVVQTALAGSLGELFEQLGLQSDAPVHEFAALVSDPGSPRQPLHPDTPYQPEAPLFTVFMALQDIDEAMGPTLFLLGTQREEAHKLFNVRGRVKERLVKATPWVANKLKAGDVAVFDSRLLHAGGDNTSDRRRTMLYFTIANPRADLKRVAPGSISPAAKGRHTLGSLQTGAK